MKQRTEALTVIVRCMKVNRAISPQMELVSAVLGAFGLQTTAYEQILNFLPFQQLAQSIQYIWSVAAVKLLHHQGNVLGFMREK